MPPRSVIQTALGVSAFIFEPSINYSQPAMVTEIGPETLRVQGMTPLPLHTRVIVELHLFIKVPDSVAKRGTPRINAEVSSADAKANTMELHIIRAGSFDPKHWDDVLDSIANSVIPAISKKKQ